MSESPRSTPRERARQQTMAEIVEIGRRHLALHGAAGLSLRAVARDLGVVSSAVYRYVKNRDELLTLLVVDGYTALGDTVDAAIAGQSDTDFSAQFRALGRAVREWGIQEPSRYGLLFGSPVPGYQAPAEQTTEPGTRVIVQLVRILEGAHLAGELNEAATRGTNHEAGSKVLHGDFAAIRAEMGLSVPDDVLTAGVLVWVALFGAVSFEVFGQYGAGTFSDPSALFDVQLDLLAGLAGFSAAVDAAKLAK